MTKGQLNEQRVYVLPNDDPRIFRLDQAVGRMNSAVKTASPSFFTGNDETIGKIQELIPVSDAEWLAFGVQNGQVLYRLHVPVDPKRPPTVEEINDKASEVKPVQTPGTPGSQKVFACQVKPTDKMNRQEALRCAQEALDRLKNLDKAS